MSDRIIIDHIRNNIIIKIGTVDLSQMTNHQILEWIRSFTERLETAHLQDGVISEPCSPSKIVGLISDISDS
jgi:hypothetical protein